MTAQVVWLTAALLVFGFAALGIIVRYDEWQERRRWERMHLTLDDLLEIQECAKYIHQYVDDLVDIGWSMVELIPGRYNGRADVHLGIRSVREHSRDIHLTHDGEKVDALLEVYQKEVRETSSLLLPELRFFSTWCRKNEEKTMWPEEGETVENFVESGESSHETGI